MTPNVRQTESGLAQRISHFSPMHEQLVKWAPLKRKIRYNRHRSGRPHPTIH